MKAAQPSTAESVSRMWRANALLVTNAIIAINVAVYLYLATQRTGPRGLSQGIINLAVRAPEVHNGEWWRLFTNSVVHFSILHILFNMLILYQVGRLLEPGAGHLRFGLLYLVSVLGGAAGALWLSPFVYTGGASGGVFGVAAAATLVMQRNGVRFWDTGFGPLLVINLVLTFTDSNISIGGHIGGLVAGTAAAEIMMQSRRIGRPQLGIIGAIGVGVLAVAIAFAAATRAVA